MADDRSMPSSFDDDKEYNETGWQKVSRKLREEPLVPLGTVLTCAALYNAWIGMRRGDHAQVQRMFRARIGAQAFTICAIVAGGAYYGADREKRKELIKLEAQQRAEERHQKWLRELEIRDDEDKQLKEHLKRRKERVLQKRAEDKEKEGVIDGLKAETTPDAEGQVPVQEIKEGSTVLGALSQAGGWFGTGKKEDPKHAEKEQEKPKK
ncbi:hypoxia induced protein conserved region-domain-containing protein [Pseudomassariella vexata]|uniref:Hypoxia induced protein conserved region-domain-containing protein n=1 Tax=Pseudomassariella vexata TaxID=1141098 RepID=A0A1Y2DFA3_9PEZI|nr:hypoxia induced protein conserved region-domain-containing protein [Pseudomassariella vexata]ORY57877.1 hypoxia induced protein conserved region-domain-containing protein [Pseudomassariella vexata]